jgi:hypothetical protein
MPVILALYATILALALWQEEHGRDAEDQSEGTCCQ